MPFFVSYFSNIEVIDPGDSAQGWSWVNTQNALNNDTALAYFKPNSDVPLSGNRNQNLYTPYLRLSGLKFLPPEQYSNYSIRNVSLVVETHHEISSGVGFSVARRDIFANNYLPYRVIKNGINIDGRSSFRNGGYTFSWQRYQGSYNNPPLSQNVVFYNTNDVYSLQFNSFLKANRTSYLVNEIFDNNNFFDIRTTFSFENYNPNLHKLAISRIYLTADIADPIPETSTHTFASYGNLSRNVYDPNQSFYRNQISETEFQNRLDRQLIIILNNFEWKNFQNQLSRDGNCSQVWPLSGPLQNAGLKPTKLTFSNVTQKYQTFSQLYALTNFFRMKDITPKITSDKTITGISFWYAARGWWEVSFTDGRDRLLRPKDDFVGLYNGSFLGTNRVKLDTYNTYDKWAGFELWKPDSTNNAVSWYGNLFTKTDPRSTEDYGGQLNSWGYTGGFTKTLLNDPEFSVLIGVNIEIGYWEGTNPYPEYGIDYAFITVYYSDVTLKSYLYPTGKQKGLELTNFDLGSGWYTGIETQEFVSNLTELRIVKLDKTTPSIPSQESLPIHILNFKQKIENPLLSSTELVSDLIKIGQYSFIDKVLSITGQEFFTNAHKLKPAAQIRPNSISSQEKFTDIQYLELAKNIEPQPGITSQENIVQTHKLGSKIEIKSKSITSSETVSNEHSLVRGSNLVTINAEFQQFNSQDKDSSYGSLNYTWVNPENAKYKDGIYTELGWDGTGEEPISQPDPIESDYFYATFLDLTSYDIPDDAQIKGIEVNIARNGRKIDTYFAYDSVVSLTLNDALIGENKAKPEYWPYDTQGFVETIYGSLNDTWGVTLTGADIKKTNFGVAVSIIFQYGNIDNIGPTPFADPVVPDHLYGIDSINLTFIYQTPIPASSISPLPIPTSETLTNQHELVKEELPVFGCITTNFIDHFSINRNDGNFGSENYSWFNLEGSYGLNNGSAAYLDWDGLEAQTVPTEDVYSDYIYVQNLLAANVIPDEYEVTGITVKINRKGQAENGTDWYAYDDTVQLVLNDELIGTNKAKTSDIWSKDFEEIEYGGPGDSWGYTLLGSDINNSTFGLAIGIKFNHTNANPYPTGFDFEIDNVEITICYQPVPEDKTIQPLPIETQETTESLDTITRHKLLKTNQDPIFYNRIFSPAYEVGYYDCLAISREVDIEPVNDLTFDSIDTNYLFAANSINMNYSAETQLGNRLAGEGANPNTFKVNSRQLTLDFTIPIRVESWGYVDSVFSAIYDYFILGHKGNATTFVGRFKYSDNNDVSGVSEIYIDNIADFTGLTTPFEAYIRTDTGGASETIIVNSVDKANKKLELNGNITNSYTPSETYIWARGAQIEEDREAAFSLFSLREGLLSGCMVDKITFNMVPGQTLEANVTIKFTNLDRAYQSILFEQFDDIVSNVNKRKPNYLINAATISLESTSTSGGSFLLGSPKESTFFRGFEELNIRDFEINEITLEFSNNLQPVYSLRSSSKSYVERFNQNRNPYAYYSNGRSITGSIKYTSPIKPWLFAEKLSGPSKINKSGLIFNFGSFKLTLPEIVWSPQSATSGMEQNLQKTVSFQVVTSSLTFDPYLEPTGQY